MPSPRISDGFKPVSIPVPPKHAPTRRPVGLHRPTYIRDAPAVRWGSGPPATLVPGPRVGTEEHCQGTEQNEKEENCYAFHDSSIAQLDY
jgi:hypothetical protein